MILIALIVGVMELIYQSEMVLTIHHLLHLKMSYVILIEGKVYQLQVVELLELITLNSLTLTG